MKSLCWPESAFAFPRGSVPETPSMLVPITPMDRSRFPVRLKGGDRSLAFLFPRARAVLGKVGPFPFPRVGGRCSGLWRSRYPVARISCSISLGTAGAQALDFSAISREALFQRQGRGQNERLWTGYRERLGLIHGVTGTPRTPILGESGTHPPFRRLGHIGMLHAGRGPHARRKLGTSRIGNRTPRRAD
jgi:hypothetical protein